MSFVGRYHPEPFDEFDFHVYNMFPSQSPHVGNVYIRPRLDIHEDEETNSITAKLELPGLKSEDISIEVEEGHLTVSGEFPKENPHSENGYSIRERRPGKFWRTIQIPGGVKPGEVKAKMEHGLLTITFPRVVVVPEQPQRIVVS